MPRRKRSAKKRLDRLTWSQEMNLILGGRTLEDLKEEKINPNALMIMDGAFEDDQERRNAWEDHGYKIRTSPGTKPQAAEDYS